MPTIRFLISAAFNLFLPSEHWRLIDAIRLQPPESDDEFLKAVACENASAATILAIRRAIAGMCRVEAIHLRAADSFSMVYDIVYTSLLMGWDDLDFIFRVEAELRRAILIKPGELPRIARTVDGPWQSKAFCTIGQWIRAAAPLIESRTGRALI